ncbi:M56 family metallopeptidase [Nesterenkonia halophila]
MIPLAVFLAALAAVLAVVLPPLISRARFRTRAPWAAMLLWQAVALAGGLSLIGAPLVYGLSPFGATLHTALATMLELLVAGDFAALVGLHVHPTHVFALCLAVLLGLHLLLTLLRTYVRVLASRRRHRDLVRLLSTPAGQTGATGAHTELGEDVAHVIEHEAPLAYCLPGRTGGRSLTVVSRGLLDQLAPEELSAVVAHERTHLQQRHHLLTMAFDAWYRALPWLPTTRHGREAVLELTEMLADDGALRGHSRTALLRSLALSSSESGEDDAGTGAARRAQGATPGAGGTVITTARLQRLLVPPPALPRTAVVAVVLASAALLAGPTAVLLVV